MKTRLPEEHWHIYLFQSTATGTAGLIRQAKQATSLRLKLLRNPKKATSKILLNNSAKNIEQYITVFPISNLFEAKIVEKSQKKSNIKDFA